MPNEIKKIQVDGINYDIVDDTAIHNLNVENGVGNYSVKNKEEIQNPGTAQEKDRNNYTFGRANIAFGHKNKTYQRDSFAFGGSCIAGNADGDPDDYGYGLAVGEQAKAIGRASFAAGSNAKALGDYSSAKGRDTTANAIYSHAEGYSNTIAATANASHAEGQQNTIAGEASHVEGRLNQVSGINAHGEGYNNIASGNSAHTEGQSTKAIGNQSHTEGYNTEATLDFAHAEGNSTVASGYSSHSEGENTLASGNNAHAEGRNTIAEGDASHAGGIGTKTRTTAQTAFGKYNLSKVDTLLEIGNGSKDSDTEEITKSNAFEVYLDGRAKVYGAPINAEDVTRKDYVDAQVATRSTVSVSNIGTATDEVEYITINNIEKKIAGGEKINIISQSEFAEMF